MGLVLFHEFAVGLESPIFYLVETLLSILDIWVCFYFCICCEHGGFVRKELCITGEF